MSSDSSHRVLALAGVFQAARLVQQLAREGHGDSAAYRASIDSILVLDPKEPIDVYGDVAGLALGLEILRDKLDGRHNGPLELELARYVIGIIHLQGRLRRHPSMLDALRRGIEAAQAQRSFFTQDDDGEGVHPSLVARLAEVYAQTLSTLTPRIMVNGEPSFLATPAIAERIRAALLAGVRAAVLWRQLGGSRWQLVFGRRKLTRQAAALRETILPRCQV
ncbi:MAG TPA: high frequency lysogenization protein HflD [Acidiferrobacterales bacterium]|jgi:high frequency lysogenization protein